MKIKICETTKLTVVLREKNDLPWMFDDFLWGFFHWDGSVCNSFLILKTRLPQRTVRSGSVELTWWTLNFCKIKTSIRRGVQPSVVQEMMLFYHQKNQRTKKSKTKTKKFTSECGCLNQLRWALQYSLPFEGTKNKTELIWVVGLGFIRAFLSSTTNVKKNNTPLMKHSKWVPSRRYSNYKHLFHQINQPSDSIITK